MDKQSTIHAHPLSRPRSLTISLLLLFTVTAGSHLALAQSMGTGTIKGIVTDPSGAAIHNATVTATDKSRNIPHAMQTDSSGGYVFSNMPIGDYSISVESTGFKKLVQESVHLDTDSITTVDVVLQIGATQESWTVTAAPPRLQTENGELGNLITGAQVSEVSLNCRNFSQFLALSPGVASTQTGRRMGVGQEGNPLMSVNGGRVNSTEFTYDGVLAMDTGGNRGLNLFPPMDAIAEVQVKTSNFAASEGSFGYGLANVTTKSGGAAFHGDLYEVFGNRLEVRQGSSRPICRPSTRISSIPPCSNGASACSASLLGELLISVAHAGNHAVHLDQQPNLNQPQPNLGVAQGTVNVNTVRRYLGYGNITYDERNASASYNALQTTLSRRMSHGLFLQASYSWSKSIVFNFGQNPFLQPNEEGLNSYDQPHNFTFSYVYDLPSLQRCGRLVHALLNGWETSGNATFSSGFPLTVTISGDRAGTGSGSQRPNVVGALNITGNVFGYFNTSAFALPALGTFGNEGSNVLRGPGIANSVNLNFLRNISFGERARLRIGADFNIFNHANFSAVGMVFGSATFGNLTASLDPRQIQLSAKLVL